MLARCFARQSQGSCHASNLSLAPRHLHFPSPRARNVLPVQPKYLRRWVDLSVVVFKHSKARGNLRASVEAAGLQCECTVCPQCRWAAV